MEAPQLEHLVDLYGPDIYRCAYFYLGDQGLAEDASQQIFMKVYENREKLDSLRSAKAWVMRITINFCKNTLKSKAYRSRHKELPLEDAWIAGSSLETDLEDQERFALIVAEIRKLPEKYRDTIILRHIKDYSCEEVADMLGIRPASVRSRLSRGLAMLRQRLEGRIDLSE